MTPEDKRELRLIIREEVYEAMQHKVTPRAKYLPTTEAAKVLGYRHRRQLIRAIDTGLLRLGIEVQDRRGADSDRPSYYFNIEACERRLQLLPEKRKS